MVTKKASPLATTTPVRGLRKVPNTSQTITKAIAAESQGVCLPTEVIRSIATKEAIPTTIPA